MTILFTDLGKLGRIGNMLFQCSAVIGAAKNYNDNWRIPYLPIMQQFNIPDWANGHPNYHHVPTYNEPHFHYVEIPKIAPMMNIKGYFQSPLYFNHCKEEVKQYLTPKFKGHYHDFTAIHVRRTDYLTHDGCYHILTRENYYDEAMELIPSDKYMVFSDDLEWCKKIFIGDQFFFSEERDPVKDLANMISCSNFIIGNSSYSFWGAWLSDDPKLVVAPKNWFGPKLAPTHDTKDLYPENWMVI